MKKPSVRNVLIIATIVTTIVLTMLVTFGVQMINLRRVSDWLSGQVNLQVLMGMAQISVLISLWYKLGQYHAELKQHRADLQNNKSEISKELLEIKKEIKDAETRIRLYQKDVNSNFREVRRVHEKMDDTLINLRERVSFLEAKV